MSQAPVCLGPVLLSVTLAVTPLAPVFIQPSPFCQERASAYCTPSVMKPLRTSPCALWKLVLFYFNSIHAQTAFLFAENSTALWARRGLF